MYISKIWLAGIRGLRSGEPMVWLLDLAARPEMAMLIDAQCLGVIERYPDIKNWL